MSLPLHVRRLLTAATLQAHPLEAVLSHASDRNNTIAHMFQTSMRGTTTQSGLRTCTGALQHGSPSQQVTRLTGTLHAVCSIVPQVPSIRTRHLSTSVAFPSDPTDGVSVPGSTSQPGDSGNAEEPPAVIRQRILEAALQHVVRTVHTGQTRHNIVTADGCHKIAAATVTVS